MRSHQLRGNSKKSLPGSSHQGNSQCTGQKQEQPWIPPQSGNWCPGCDTGDTSLRLSCSGRKRHRRLRPTIGIPRCFPRFQEQARLRLMREHLISIEWCQFQEYQLISFLILSPPLPPPLTYPLSCVDTVILFIGVARVWTLSAV